MAYLLDTHTLIWFTTGDAQLPQSIKSKILNKNQSCFISVASFWEIAIKQQLGKLKLEITLKDFYDYAENNQIEVIPINYEHLKVLSNLPRIHNDPFDRLIISQAIAEDLILLSRDEIFQHYPASYQWK